MSGFDLTLSCRIFDVLFFLVILSSNSIYATSPCLRFPPGSYVQEPAQYSSILGLLDIRLEFKAGLGSDGNMQFCYLTEDGLQSPTLLVWPGDTLRMSITNLVDSTAWVGADFEGAKAGSFATNVHFHGMAVSPQPGQDFAITMISPGETFVYQIKIPPDHPIGMHWYSAIASRGWGRRGSGVLERGAERAIEAKPSRCAFEANSSRCPAARVLRRCA